MGKFQIKKRGFDIVMLALSIVVVIIFFQNCGVVGRTNSSSLSSSPVGSTVGSPVPSTLSPPYAPNQVVLSIGTARQINLTWADNSNNETGFRIERAFSNAGPFTAGTGPAAFAVVTTVSANVTSYSDMALNPGTFYYYRIYAVNAAGSSAPTVAALLQTPAAAVVTPSAPSGLTATPAAATIININWTDNSTNENSFNLERSIDNGASFTLIAVISANTTTYRDINLLEAKTYTYRLKAVNDMGASALTANVATTTPAAGNTALFNYVNTNIIVPNCVRCHGGIMVAAGVNLNSYAGVLAVVTAGNAATSKLYLAVNSGSMPPAGPLSALQITAIQNWINAGALNN